MTPNEMSFVTWFIEQGPAGVLAVACWFLNKERKDLIDSISQRNVTIRELSERVNSIFREQAEAAREDVRQQMETLRAVETAATAMKETTEATRSIAGDIRDLRQMVEGLSHD